MQFSAFPQFLSWREEHPRDGRRGKAQLTTVTATNPIKGVSKGVTLKVTSGTQSAACGYDFREAPKTLTIGGEKVGRNMISVRRCTMYNLNH